MASSSNSGFSSTDGWKLGVLFLLFVVISYAFISFNHKLENYLRERKLRALRHVLHKLQHEIMLLGFISLSLIALQEPLLKICTKESVSSISSGYVDDPAEKYTHSCPVGEKPFWSATTIHQTHIFIFILAVTHVAYISLSMLVCIIKLNSWKKWEQGNHDIVPLNPHINPRLVIDANLIVLIWRAFWAQFRFSVNRELYLSLRRLFVERLGTPDDFHFHDFLVEAMEEDFANIIDTKVFMWFLAALWVTVPKYVFLPGGIAALAIMLFVGTMLEAVNIRLAQAAYERFEGEAATSKIVDKDGNSVSADGSSDGGDDRSSIHGAASPLGTGTMQAIAEDGKPTTNNNNQLGPSKSFGDYLKDRAGGFFKGVKEIVIPGNANKELTSEERSRRRRALRAEIDSKNYFWRGKPQILLTIFQYVLFENAMSLAMLIFSAWQDPDWLNTNANVKKNASVILFAVDILVLLHSAYFILPVYAISSVVGTHCSMSLVQYAKKMGISNERAVEAYRKRSDVKRNDGNDGNYPAGDDEFMYDSSGTQTPDFITNAADEVLNAAASQSTKKSTKGHHHHVPELFSHFVGLPTDKKRNEVTIAPFDHSLDNERSMTALLGAILTKQMRELRAKEAARAAQKNRPRPHTNHSPLAALKRTMSGRGLNLGLEEMTDSQQLPNSRFQGEALSSPKWDVSERAKLSLEKEETSSSREQQNTEEQQEEQQKQQKTTASSSSGGRMVSSTRAVPSLKDVFRFTEQQPARTRMSLGEEPTSVGTSTNEQGELEEVVVVDKRRSIDLTQMSIQEESTNEDNDEEKKNRKEKNDDVPLATARSLRDIFPSSK